MTRSATSLSFATSATEDPPYFWTTTDIAGNSPFLQLFCEARHDRRVIARAHFLLHRTRRRPCGERFARKDMIEAPADVALAHLPPRRPPGEHPVVVRIQRASDVDEA